MTKYELTFGQTPCEIEVRGMPTVTGEPGYLAAMYVWENQGRALREVGDPNGVPLELPASTEQAALDRACEYLAKRFGPQAAAAPTRHKGRWTVRPILEPPLKDVRQ